MMDTHAERLDGDALRPILERLLEGMRSKEAVGAEDLVRLFDPDETARLFGAGDAGESVRVDDIVRRLGQGATLAHAAGLDLEELEALYGLASSLFDAGDTERALGVFRFLCMQHHLEYRYWLALGIAQARLGQHGQAVRSFTMGALLTGDDPRFPLHSAESHRQLGNLAEARSGAELALAFCRGGEWQAVVERRAKAVLAALSDAAESGRPVADGDGS